MKNLSFLTLLTTLFLVMTLTQSCGTDPCEEVACQNGAICADGACDCTNGYEGDLCQTEWRAKMLGNYTVNQACGAATYGPYDYTITANPDDVLKTSFDGIEGTRPVHFDFTMTGEKTFDVPNQVPCSGCLQHGGSGIIEDNGNITITYLRSDGVTCTDNLTPR